MAKSKKEEIKNEDINTQESEAECENAEAKETVASEKTDASEETNSLEEKELEAKLSELEEKNAELEEKYLRLAAEYKNYQARAQREKDELYSKSVSDAVEALLPVIDSVERAEGMAKDSKSVEDVCAGIELIAKMTREAFEKLGVEAIEAVGKEFDANVHNAVMHIDDESVGENTVVEEFMKGYKMKDKVIRYSMVKVAN